MTLVYVWASWSEPSTRFREDVEAFAKRRGWRFEPCNLDLDLPPCTVVALPTIAVFDEGDALVDKLIGAGRLEALCPSQRDA